MISAKSFVDSLLEKDINFFVGVPDSLLKSLCAYITDHVESKNNIITPNEGAAIGLAAGYHLATGKIPVVYMQNSGQGNALNPLISLIDKEVYNIPMLILVGWRGEPGTKDEPQHVKQGKVTNDIFKSIGINYDILSKDEAESDLQLANAINYIKKSNEPFAFIVQKDTYDQYLLVNTIANNFQLSRENAIDIIISHIDNQDVIVSSTGMISRELFEIKEKKGLSHENDFLTVGSMGHSIQIALGIAMQKPNKGVYCIDGDGSLLMHMGSLTTVGDVSPTNLIHFILNNGAHDSVGGQPTVGLKIQILDIAKAAGYNKCFSVQNGTSLIRILRKIKKLDGPILIEIKVKKGNRSDLGRPLQTPIENKTRFMNFLNE